MVQRLALIIPAAGSGTRLNSSVPKPYLEIGGRSILEHTVGKFAQLEQLTSVIIACQAEHLEQTQAMLSPLLPEQIRLTVVEGGSERQYSIMNALEEVGDEELTAVHDAVRPFVTPEQIKRCAVAAQQHGGAILAVPAKDTIKKVENGGRITETPDRNLLWQAQTPQIFRTELLKAAFQKAISEQYRGTDDASLVERVGGTVHVVEGSRENFKITYPLDMKVAEALLEV